MEKQRGRRILQLIFTVLIVATGGPGAALAADEAEVETPATWKNFRQDKLIWDRETQEKFRQQWRELGREFQRSMQQGGEELEQFFERGKSRLQPGFRRYPAPGEARGTVVLLHGNLATAQAMAGLAGFLTRNGYTVLNYNWGTMPAGTEEEFLRQFREEAVSGRLFFLTHSLGGVRLGKILLSMTESERKRITGVVMLAPAAYLSAGAKMVFVPADWPNLEVLHSEAFQKLPFRPPILVLAGEDDEYLSPVQTSFPGIKEQKLLPATHSGLRDPEISGASILDFLNSGSENRESSDETSE